MEEEWFIVLETDHDLHATFPVGMYRTREEAINRVDNQSEVSPRDDFDVFKVKEGDM